MMRNKILLGAFLAGTLATGYAFFANSPSADAADGGRNLKVLSKSLTKDQLKTLMKGISNALGVQCDHCHNEDDMALDTPKKEEARAMMKMVIAVNKQYFKGAEKVTCMTCHKGKKKPE